MQADYRRHRYLAEAPNWLTLARGFTAVDELITDLREDRDRWREQATRLRGRRGR